jgi:molybdopterin converting factor small subunit
VSVKINIHKTHRQLTDGLDVVDVEGATVGECLRELVKRFPDMGKKLFDGKGKLQNVIEVYVNMESAYPDELAKTVKDGDEIHITLMLAGG